MKLHILRHAKTEPISNSGKDFDRALLKKGILQSESMSTYFAENNISPQHVFCSDAKRTRQTASYLKDTIAFQEIQYIHDLYLSSHETILKFLCSKSGNSEILLIGHNNGISDLVNYLTDEFTDLQTCEYVCIDLSISDWAETSRSTGKIIDRHHPQVVN